MIKREVAHAHNKLSMLSTALNNSDKRRGLPMTSEKWGGGTPI